jgi:arabinose-5-phosphate isomerase
MDCIDISRSVFSQEINELKKVSARIGPEMRDVVDMIYHCKGKTVVTGIGKTGLIGRKIAASLASTGTMSVFMNATDAIHGDLGIVGPEDVVIAISNSGSTSEINNILTPIRKIGAKIVAMTGNPDSPLGREADLILNVAVGSEACPLGQAPTTSTTATLVMGDALTVCLMQKRGFRVDDYAKYHPGGALGRKLLNRVEDLMSHDIPTVKESEVFKNVIYVISDRRKGMTMVVNEDDVMTGIITDGDIRRAIQCYDDILSMRAVDFMTHGFKKISASAQINDALEIMTTSKITSLAVHAPKDTNRILGLITIHDIIECDLTR